MLTVVVRGFGSEMTHVVTVPRSLLVSSSWPSPSYPFTGIPTPVMAECFTVPRSVQPVLVVMNPGTKVRCRQCRRVTGITEQHAGPCKPGTGRDWVMAW